MESHTSVRTLPATSSLRRTRSRKEHVRLAVVVNEEINEPPMQTQSDATHNDTSHQIDSISSRTRLRTSQHTNRESATPILERPTRKGVRRTVSYTSSTTSHARRTIQNLDAIQDNELSQSRPTTETTTSNTTNTSNTSNESSLVPSPPKRIKLSSDCAVQTDEKEPPAKEPEKPKEKHSQYELQCPICWENLQELKSNDKCLMATFCGHVLCNFCLEAHFKLGTTMAPTPTRNKTILCPTCRTKLTRSKIHNLYL